MTKSDVQAEVLAANEAFYRAFATRDLAAMGRIWAEAAEPICVHPGWTPLIGRAAVMESWAGILGNPEAPRIRCFRAWASVEGEFARVVCYEIVERSVLVATNLFVRERGEWRLCHHQAGPATGETGVLGTEDSADGPASKRLH